MATKYIVKHIDTNTIEVIVDTQKDFVLWLKKHNKRREEEGECRECVYEFELKEIEYFNNN